MKPTDQTAGRENYQAPKPGLIERLLMKILPFYDIVNVENGENVLYLRRFILRKDAQKGNIFLHHIYKSDADRHPHSHPWAFDSFIISGGYTDEAYDVSWLRGIPTRTEVEKNPSKAWPVLRSPLPRKTVALPGRIYRRPSSHVHMLKLHPGKTAWTLVRTTGQEQPWGFLSENSWYYWRDYLQDWTSDPG